MKANIVVYLCGQTLLSQVNLKKWHQLDHDNKSRTRLQNYTIVYTNTAARQNSVLKIKKIN